ncbi:WD40/YVTN/BNR-like repeat-containing protein [Streptomyces sp. NPDC021020]|uniref:WD40/YVTN/BNR-like repeat-containing protein n=1 Tax=Streptomyces sp. NPDC021020 TaxID=3365109 RepID=UPI0037BD722C
MTPRGGRLAVVAGLAACAVLVLAGCGSEHGAGGGDTSATKLGFTRYANAVEYAAQGYGTTKAYVAPGEGLRQLVPLGDCALGIGTYANGYHYVNVNWAGSKGCTSFAITPRPAEDEENDKPYSMRTGWIGGGLAADVVVPWTGGALLGVGARLTLQTPDGEQTSLAELPLTFRLRPEEETSDDASVNTAAKVGDRLLIGGGEYVDQVETPYVLASDDAGRTVHRVHLPTVNGLQPPTPVGGFAVDGTQVVAVGLTASNAYDYHTPDGTLPFWYSSDSGTHWTAGQVTGTPPGTVIRNVLRSQGRWYAVGGRAAKGEVYDSLPFVLTSVDGLHWTRVDSAAMGDGEIVTATVDGNGRLVLVGTAAQRKTDPDTRSVYCGSVWIGDGTPDTAKWRRGGLGCSENPPTTAVTLAGGRVLIAGNADLWATAARRT